MRAPEAAPTVCRADAAGGAHKLNGAVRLSLESRQSETCCSFQLSPYRPVRGELAHSASHLT